MKYIKLLIVFTVLPLLLFVMFQKSFDYVEENKPPPPPVNKEVVETKCGGANFRVEWIRDQGGMKNSYIFSMYEKTKWVDLWVGDGPFYVACLNTAEKKPMMVMQTFCNQPWCAEGWYAAVDPQKAKADFVLYPKYVDYHNINEISKFLGYRVPHLAKYSGTVCCVEK